MTNKITNERGATKLVQLPVRNRPIYCLWHIEWGKVDMGPNIARCLTKSQNWNEIRSNAEAIFCYDPTAYLFINEEDDLYAFHWELDINELTGIYSIVDSHDCPVRYDEDDLDCFEFKLPC